MISEVGWRYDAPTSAMRSDRTAESRKITKIIPVSSKLLSGDK